MDVPITVILPVRNGGAYIEKAIESVLAQSFHGFQLVVSDNCSMDNTSLLISKYLNDPRVKLISQTEHFDMTAHFNRCLDMSRTKYYMLLCHDDYLYNPAALEKAYNALEKYPAISAAYCDMAYVDKVGSLIHVRRFDREGVVNSDELAKRSVISTRNLFGIPLLVRSKAVKDLRYDKHLPYAADLDLSIAISRHGSIYHIKEPLIANRYHGGNATVSLFSLALEQMKMIANKHDISLSRLEEFYMFFNAWKAAFQKLAFFQYMEKIRTY